MSDLDSELDSVLGGDGPIPREKVLLWIDAAADLLTLSKLYRLTDESYYRIQPDLGRDATCALIQRYLLECIRQDVKNSDEIEGRWEAAQSLHFWFRHLLEMGGASDVLTEAAKAVTELFLQSGEEVRNAVEQGFLEHALETAAIRPYFEYWASDPQLRDAWERALEWGKAHPDFTWSMLQRIQKAQEE